MDETYRKAGFDASFPQEPAMLAPSHPTEAHMGRAQSCIEALEPRRMLSDTPTPGLHVQGTGTFVMLDVVTTGGGVSELIAAGAWDGIIDFGDGKKLTANGQDGFIARYSDKNQLLWVNVFTGP